MEQFMVLVKTKDEPGAGTFLAYLNARSIYEATQMAKAMYGRLLISESAMPAR